MEPISQSKSLSKNRFSNSSTVNSNKIYIPTVNRTVNSNSTSKKILGFIKDLGYSTDDIANTLADGLGDHKSLRFYQLLAEENPHEKLLEALSYVKDADRQNRIKYKPAYYYTIIKNWGLKVKFKESKNEA